MHELGQLLDEELTESEMRELEECEEVCKSFLSWDLTGEDGSVKVRLREVLGRKCNEEPFF